MSSFEAAVFQSTLSFDKPVLLFGPNKDKLLCYQQLLEKGCKENNMSCRSFYDLTSFYQELEPSLFAPSQKELFIVHETKNLDLDRLPHTPEQSFIIFAPALRKPSKLLKPPLAKKLTIVEATPWTFSEKTRCAQHLLKGIDIPDVVTDLLRSEALFLQTPLSTLASNIDNITPQTQAKSPWENVSRETFSPDVGTVRLKIYQTKNQLTRQQGSPDDLLKKMALLLAAEKKIKSSDRPTIEQGLIL